MTEEGAEQVLRDLIQRSEVEPADAPRIRLDRAVEMIEATEKLAAALKPLSALERRVVLYSLMKALDD